MNNRGKRSQIYTELTSWMQTRVLSGQEILSNTDEAAEVVARTVLRETDGAAVEVWEGPRFVCSWKCRE
jgi:hypothetical protein